MPRSEVHVQPTYGGACSPKYEVVDSQVPVTYSHGHILRRHWIYRNEAWCDLCQEPVDSYLVHSGKKDHVLLDVSVTALCLYPRTWDAKRVLMGIRSLFGGDGPVEQFYDSFRREEHDRRVKLLGALQFLADGKWIQTSNFNSTCFARMCGLELGSLLQGALLQHEILAQQVLRIYHEGDIATFAYLMDFIMCSYNMETVYDLVGLRNIDPQGSRMGISSPQASGISGLATALSTEQESTSAPATRSPLTSRFAQRTQRSQEEAAFSHKVSFVREILTQLRWALSESKRHPSGKEMPGHIQVLAEYCGKSLVTECVGARICEYVIRADPIWQRHGMERRKLVDKEIVSQSVTPRFTSCQYRDLQPDRMDLVQELRDTV